MSRSEIQQSRHVSSRLLLSSCVVCRSSVLKKRQPDSPRQHPHPRTKGKQAEQEREQLLEADRLARSEAEATNRIKDEFLAVLCHELRQQSPRRGSPVCLKTEWLRFWAYYILGLTHQKPKTSIALAPPFLGGGNSQSPFFRGLGGSLPKSCIS